MSTPAAAMLRYYAQRLPDDEAFRRAGAAFGQFIEAVSAAYPHLRRLALQQQRHHVRADYRRKSRGHR